MSALSNEKKESIWSKPLTGFMVALIIYFIVSISAFIILTHLFFNVPGNLSRWLAFGTIVQAVVAAAAIVGVSVSVLIVAKSADQLAREQRDIAELHMNQTQRLADLEAIYKVEADARDIFDKGIAIRQIIGIFGATYDAMYEHDGRTCEESNIKFADLQDKLFGNIHSLVLRRFMWVA